MKSLHTISKSPSTKILKSCLGVISEGDALLFIEDGVYHSVSAQTLHDIPNDILLFSLREDMLARGIYTKYINSIEPIDYQRFVELSCEYGKVVSWF